MGGVFLPDLTRKRKLLLFKNHSRCFPAKIWGLLCRDYSHRGKRNAQSLWNPGRIQAFVLVIIYAFRTDHWTTKLISPQRFYLYYVQWTFHRHTQWFYLFSGIRMIRSQKMQLQGKSHWGWVIFLWVTEYWCWKRKLCAHLWHSRLGMWDIHARQNFKSASSRHLQDTHQSG